MHREKNKAGQGAWPQPGVLAGQPGRRIKRLLGVLGGLYLLTLAGSVFIPWGPVVIHYALLWNLLLAALPLVFALLVQRREAQRKRGVATLLLLLLWLVFFPNAPYLITDFLHLGAYTYWAQQGFVPDVLSWAAMLHVTTGVLAGCVCGMLSLYLVHRLVEKRFGSAAGWALVLVVSLAGGVAIHLGRFIRFNTWDLAVRPWAVAAQVLGAINPQTLALYLIFSAMTLLPYSVFYALFKEA